MSEQFFIGVSFAFAAAVMPGPLQAFLLASVTRNGWRRTLPAAVAPVISDVPIAAIMLLALGKLPEALNRTLQAAGGLFLLHLAWMAWRDWRRPPAPTGESSSSTPRTLWQAVLVNVLNPNPWLGWSLVLGPACIRAWHQAPAHAVALVASFYVTMAACLGAIIVIFGATRWLGPAARRALVLASAAALAVLGAHRLVAAVITH